MYTYSVTMKVKGRDDRRSVEMYIGAQCIVHKDSMERADVVVTLF